MKSVDAVTENLSGYVRKQGINLSRLSRDTGIPYIALYNSLANSNRKRSIRGQELIDICRILGVDPRDFAGKGV